MFCNRLSTLATTAAAVGLTAGFAATSTEAAPVLAASYDASLDTAGDSVWENEVSPGTDDLPFASPISPVSVSSTDLPLVTSAYEFPAAATPDSGSFDFADINGISNNDDVTFEIVADIPDALTDNQVLWETGGSTDGVSLYTAAGDGTTQNLVYRSNGGTLVSTPLVASDVDDFLHIVAVWESGTSAELFVNGVSVGSKAFGDSTLNGSNEGGLGRIVGGNSTAFSAGDFTGEIAAFNIYEGAATAGEVVDLQQAFIPEPGSLALLGLGSAALFVRRRSA